MNGYNKEYWENLKNKDPKDLTKQEKKAIKDKKYRDSHRDELLIKKKEYSDKIWAVRKEERKKKD